MLANPVLEFFIIAKASEEIGPAEQKYLIRTRRSNGQWTTEPIEAVGTSDVRWFLNDNGVDERDIALAIEELSRTRYILVRSRAGFKAA